MWNLDTDRRNTVVYQQNRDRPLAEILAESQAVHEDLVQLLEELPEEHYGNSARVRGVPADWLPWRVLEGNTFGHYREHARDVRAWLDRTTA